MLKLIRALTLALVASVAVPCIASAADVTPAQRTAIENAGMQLFRAVVDGNAKGVLALTAPTYTLTTLEGQTLSANDLAAKWQVMMVEYGGVYGDAKLISASTDGNAITALYSINAYANSAGGGRDAPSTSQLNAVHKIVWTPTGGSWKAASDVVLRQSSDFR